MQIFFNKYKFWIILFIIFLLLRIPSLFEPNWYGDEGIYLVLGQAIRKGLVLYKNIHDNKPPALYFLAAISQTVFGFRLLLLLFMIPTIYLFNRLSKFFLSDQGSRIATFIFLLLTSIPLVEGNIANAEVFMLLPTIAAVLFLINSKQPRISQIIISGLLLGFAFTIKIPVVIEFIFLCLWLLIDHLTSFKKIFSNIKTVVIFSISFIIPIIFWTIYYSAQGALVPFLNASLFQNFGYLSSWATGTHTSSVSSGGLIVRLFVLLIAWFLIFILKIKQEISKNFSFILFWFSATIFGSLLSGRPYPHYLIQVLPPLALVLVELVNFKNRKNQVLSLLCLFIFSFTLFKFNFYYYPVFSYYSNFYSHLVGKKSTADYRNYFGSQINDMYEISDYIKSNTTSVDKIFVWGDLPYIYALSDRLPTSRYTVAYHIVDFDGYVSTMDKLKSNLPKFIVYTVMPDRPFPALDNFINNYYFPVKLFGNITVYKLR
jgi:4-amino-4-deoxy-L-arabinose transferase-like glycosyltransferase